jgi:hypothetical protein
LLDFSTAAREHAPEYLAVLLKSLKSNNWKERHSALSMLLDRAFGKPNQPITGPDGGSLTFLHLVAMKEVGERIVAELVVQQSGAVAHSAHGGNGEQPPDAVVDLGAPARE